MKFRQKHQWGYHSGLLSPTGELIAIFAFSYDKREKKEKGV